jgi:Na+-translocating ferredoxin:NAD+ oxidoreductase RnfD subunit
MKLPIDGVIALAVGCAMQLYFFGWFGLVLISLSIGIALLHLHSR